jgi:hypothetical protein
LKQCTYSRDWILGNKRDVKAPSGSTGWVASCWCL